MGMAASQARLLQLTSRKHDIGYELTRLSNDKVSLARDMQKISRKYQESLNQKLLKWSNNNGVSYIDLSYNNLMKPSTMNQNKPYLLTDQNDKIIVDSEYKKYAEMISPTGTPGGDWDSVRTKILSELTGIDANKIDTANLYQEEIWASEAVINNLIEEEPILPKKETHIEDFIANIGNSTGITAGFSEGDDWKSAYSKAGKIDLGDASVAPANLKAITEHIATQLGQFIDDPDKLKLACEAFYNEQVGIINDSDNMKDSLESDFTALNLNGGTFSINVKQMIDTIVGGSYASDNCNVNNGGYANKSTYQWNDINSGTYMQALEAHNTWQESYDLAKTEYDNAVQAKNQLFTAEEEALIKFYDAIFSSIAEKGWESNDQVNDTQYLNQMLQNNIYTMTTVDRDAEYSDEHNSYLWDNEYSTDIASNFTNIFFVNDSNARDEALVAYEHEKSIINEKESRIDTRMQNLQTEQSAINQMIQGIESVKKENIDRTMNIFG